MSALDGRVLRETIRSLRQAMPPEEFAREFLVWWEDPPLDTASQVFGPHWGRQGIADAVAPKPLCVGVAVEPGRSHSSLAAVGHYGGADVRVVFPASSNPELGGRRPGASWVVEEACGISDRHGIPVAIAGGGPGADLVDQLRERLGDLLLVADMADLKDACAAFYDGITETHTVYHNDSPEMNDAAREATRRMSAGRFLWDRSMLEAGSVALWGASAKPQSLTPMAAFI